MRVRSVVCARAVAVLALDIEVGGTARRVVRIEHIDARRIGQRVPVLTHGVATLTRRLDVVARQLQARPGVGMPGPLPVGGLVRMAIAAGGLLCFRVVVTQEPVGRIGRWIEGVTRLRDDRVFRTRAHDEESQREHSQERSSYRGMCHHGLLPHISLTPTSRAHLGRSY